MKETVVTLKTAIDRYGDVPVKFASYYKYSFSFKGDFNGKTLTLFVGGDAGDIYRFSVTADAICSKKLLTDWFGEISVSEDGTSITLMDAY